MPEKKYSRILLKLSGESLKGKKEYGLDIGILNFISKQILSLQTMGLEIGIVIGGGNIWRGVDYEMIGMDRSTADSAGMLATIMNALSLQDSLESMNVDVRSQSSINVPSVAEPYIRRRAIRHMEKGRVVIFAGGTGNPYFTTDTAAVLRAIEINADIVLKGTKVDGVFSDDPEKNPNAKLYEFLNYKEVINNDLESNLEILAEAIQTILRREQVEGAYEHLKELTRGKALDNDKLISFIDSLKIDESVKNELKELSPQNYSGLASKLAKEI